MSIQRAFNNNPLQQQLTYYSSKNRREETHNTNVMEYDIRNIECAHNRFTKKFKYLNFLGLPISCLSIKRLRTWYWNTLCVYDGFSYTILYSFLTFAFYKLMNVFSITFINGFMTHLYDFWIVFHKAHIESVFRKKFMRLLMFRASPGHLWPVTAISTL